MKIRVQDGDGFTQWIDVSDLLAAAGVTVTGTPLSELSAENAALLVEREGLLVQRDGLLHDNTMAARENSRLCGVIESMLVAIAGNAELRTQNDALLAQVDELTQTVANRDAEIAALTAQWQYTISQRDAARAIIKDIQMRTSQVQP